MLYRDKQIPLSFFGDFHQVCTGNPLNTESPDTEGKGKRRERGMFYTPAPIVEFEDPKTYDDAATQIALLRLRKVRPPCDGRYAVIGGRGRLRHKLEQLDSGQVDSEISTTLLSPSATASSRWNLASSDDDSWLGTVRQAGIPLGRLVTIESGLSTGIDRLLLLKKTGRGVGRTVVTESRDEDNNTIRLEEAGIRSVVRGHQLRGYQPPKLRHVHPFPYDAKGRVFVESDLRVRFPLMHAYLSRKKSDLSKRKLAKGCPWYSTFIRQPKCLPHRPRLMSAKITSGNSFSIIDDLQLLAHCSVVVLTDHARKVDPYYLLGIVNSKVFTRYVSLTMPKTNVGRYSLRLSRLRQFTVPDPACEGPRQPSQAISSLVRDIVQHSMDRPPSPELMMPSIVELRISTVSIREDQEGGCRRTLLDPLHAFPLDELRRRTSRG